MDQGTPKNLAEVVIRIMTTPAVRISQRHGEYIIHEFLNQRFGAAILHNHKNADVVLELEKLLRNIKGET